MAEIVNLRRARKRKSRDQAAGHADAQRTRHGRPKAERKLESARRGQADARLEGHRLDQPDGDA